MIRTTPAYPIFARTLLRHAFTWLFAAVLPLAPFSASFFGPTDALAREPLATRYLRAVHVLRQMNPGDHWPELGVPRRVKNNDATNALVMHPDKSFVLGAIVRDLSAATASGKYPEAGYYAAHALAMRDNHAEAAAAMRTYLAKAPFRDADYLFLVRELYAARDYAGVRAAALQWQSLDGSDDTCSEDRLTYVWGTFHATGRHRDAMEAVLSDPCASWRGQLLFARSCLALGDEQGAEARLATVLQAFPDKNREIHLFWNRLATAARYP
ncbi:hypothetical protein LJC26_08030 [Desulfovibrio sp. OttesenSCG-928-O18]|nr:hypothetical protein [Desulfovibrio sp. OttesenSCG-928-O18]